MKANTSIYIDPDLKEDAQIIALKEGTSLTDIIRKSLVNYINQKAQKS